MFSTILFLSPHTDDAELGCGGSIARFVEEGKSVHCAAFSAATVLDDKSSISEEFWKSMKCLGIENRAEFLKFKTRKLDYKRQDVLEKLFLIKKLIGPDLVFAPSKNDSHQDHQTIAMEAARAFQSCTTLGYEIPWNNAVFRTQNFIVLEARHIEKKVDALKCYKSQRHRGYFEPDYIWALARMRGMQVGAKYAEAFEVNRWIV